MRVARYGLWTIVGALALSELAELGLVLALRIVEALDLDPKTGHLRVVEIYGWVQHVQVAALIAGAIACAAGDAVRRKWYVGVAAGTALGWTLATWGLLRLWTPTTLDEMRWILRCNVIVHALTACSFAMAAWRSDARRALVKAFAIAIAVRVLLFLEQNVMSTDHGGWLELARAVAFSLAGLVWIFVVLDMLGAFPVDTAAPVARVRSGARTTAAAVAVAAIVAGVALAAVAVWIVDRVSSVDATRGLLSHGICVFAAGAFALRRMRRHTSIAAWIASMLVLAFVARFALGAREVSAENVTLEPQVFPGVTISLPPGKVEKRLWYRERGQVNVLARHADLGLVTVEWMSPAEDPLGGFSRMAPSVAKTEAYTQLTDGIQVSGSIVAMDHYTAVYASWQCPHDSRWFKVELSRYQPDALVLRRIADRVFASIHCDATTLDAAPPFAIPLPTHDYRPVTTKAPRLQAWEGDAGRVSLAWSASDDYVDAMTRAPQALFESIGFSAENAQQLPKLHIDKRDGDVETEDRDVLQVIANDRRAVTTAWRCFHLDIDVVAFHVGPASAPLQPVLDTLQSIRCPPTSR